LHVSGAVQVKVVHPPLQRPVAESHAPGEQITPRVGEMHRLSPSAQSRVTVFEPHPEPVQ
jgi:hypothetical protein